MSLENDYKNLENDSAKQIENVSNKFDSTTHEKHQHSVMTETSINSSTIETIKDTDDNHDNKSVLFNKNITKTSDVQSDEPQENASEVEEVDPTAKPESEDVPDLAAADPLCKDAEINVDLVDGPEYSILSMVTRKQEEKDSAQDNLADRIVLSVKPAGELLESNFVDVTNEEQNEVAEPLQFDPIETSEEPELFNGKDVETILAEDDTTESDEGSLDAGINKGDKYIITLANLSEPCKCSLCDSQSVPIYLVHKDNINLHLCSTSCLDKFKCDYAGNYVARILKLRVFATEESRCQEMCKITTMINRSSIARDAMALCEQCTLGICPRDYLIWKERPYCEEGCLRLMQETLLGNHCAQCDHLVTPDIFGRYCPLFGSTTRQFCKNSCSFAYRKLNRLCAYCHEDLLDEPSADPTTIFCSNRCVTSAKPSEINSQELNLCAVCGEVKNVAFKVRDVGQRDSMCSDKCFVAYKFVKKVDLLKCEMCSTVFERLPGDHCIYEHTQEVHPLCSSHCQKYFLVRRRKIDECYICKERKFNVDMIKLVREDIREKFCCLYCMRVYLEGGLGKVRLMLSKVKNLAGIGTEYPDLSNNQKSVSHITYMFMHRDEPAIKKLIVTKMRPIFRQRNKATMCQPRMLTKAIQCKSKERTVQEQTEDTYTRMVPFPAPVYVSTPLHMHVEPVPLLTPIPLPMIVPIFLITGRKSVKGIEKEIQKIKSRIPADPLEAEILMMADMAAGVKRNEPASDSDDDSNRILETSIPIEASTSFSDDMLSMAFKMAHDYTEPLDLESEVDNSTRLAATGRRQVYKSRGRSQRMLDLPKPDEHLNLKFTFGVNAWKQWAMMKNHEMQKLKNAKLIKLDLLQLSAEDLCYYLCQFIKEVRKPNGSTYASDTVYYLCLGIQLYLYESGRIDNLFCDTYYEKFTDTFNEICLSFCQLYNDNQFIVTRVEEEHLWESKQLGAHSPLVLLNTLLFFNTKHFNLVTVDEHLQLSFSHIMKHWKRNTNAPNQRNVLLRFYPPTKGVWGKRKVYEQQECIENPLRCPVRLYEFFLSKCPESVKTRNDVFYLQPERSCVPDSPVWYSTSPLDRNHLEKMLNRMKLIKEVSMAILST